MRSRMFRLICCSEESICTCSRTYCSIKQLAGPAKIIEIKRIDEISENRETIVAKCQCFRRTRSRIGVGDVAILVFIIETDACFLHHAFVDEDGTIASLGKGYRVTVTRVELDSLTILANDDTFE